MLLRGVLVDFLETSIGKECQKSFQRHLDHGLFVRVEAPWDFFSPGHCFIKDRQSKGQIHRKTSIECSNNRCQSCREDTGRRNSSWEIRLGKTDRNNAAITTSDRRWQINLVGSAACHPLGKSVLQARFSAKPRHSATAGARFLRRTAKFPKRKTACRGESPRTQW